MKQMSFRAVDLVQILLPHGCEWVNVFLVPTHLGSPGQRARVSVLDVTHTQPFNGLLSGTTWVGRYHTHTRLTVVVVRDYLGRPVPEETFTHSHPS